MPSLLFLAVIEFAIPLRPGTWWEYRESYAERLREIDSISDEPTRFEVQGTEERPFIRQTGGVDPASGPVEVGEGWIRLAPWTGEDALPLPLAVGGKGPSPEAGAAVWAVEAEEDVTVPAGRYRALRCALRGPAAVAVLWIAPGVGVVREHQGAPRTRPQVERVLVRYGRPKDPGERPPAARPPAR